MNVLRRWLAIGAIASAVAGCTHSNWTPNVIRLDPSGSSGDPAHVSISSSFTLTAVEDGYTGQFTADTIAGTCWVVQSPVTTGGAWVVVPEGKSCARLDTEKIQVKDQKGNSAVTYVRSTM